MRTLKIKQQFLVPVISLKENYSLIFKRVTNYNRQRKQIFEQALLVFSIYFLFGFKYNILESLILAQDERWRRA